MEGCTTVGDVKRDLEYTKEIFNMVKRNRNKKDIVLNGLITLFEDTAVCLSCFPEHEQIVEYFCGLQCEGKELPKDELDIFLFNINAAIKDTERQLKGLNYNQILFE